MKEAFFPIKYCFIGILDYRFESYHCNLRSPHVVANLEFEVTDRSKSGT